MLEPLPPAEAPRRGPGRIARAVARRLIRPLVEIEFARYQAEVDARAQRVAEAAAAVTARESAVAAREQEIASLVNGVKKDIIATNYRLDWLESHRTASSE